MEEKDGTIYIATNILNGKQYVGQTIQNFEIRARQHKNVKDNRPFSNAIKKYGINGFKWIPIYYSITELDKMEIFWIKNLNTLAPNGYNIEGGGNKNKIISQATRIKIGEKSKGRIPTKETREKMSITRKGKKTTPIYKRMEK